jgi:PKD domain
VKRRVLIAVGAAALALAVVSSAPATPANLVPNPGFENGCGGPSPVPCDWQSPAGVTISQDFSNPHGGSASLEVATAEDSGTSCVSEDPGVCAWASTYGSCVTAGDGAFSASFWYRTIDPAIQYVGLWAVLWSQPGCTGLGPAYLLSTQAIADGAWHRVAGTFADFFPGTQSAAFTVFAGCDYCTDDISASFDDVEVAVLGDDTVPPETTIVSGPSASTTSTSATFEFTANEPSTFTCSLDGQPFTWCESPTTYYGLSEGSHTFRVRATDGSANIDPTPAERSWLVTTNAPPSAAFAVSCTGLSCTIDGSPSSDDGTIVSYAWSFGDGTTGSGPTFRHVYASPGTYTVTLTVTDDDGAVDDDSTTVVPITLTATGSRIKARQRADLAWTGSSVAGFAVHRNDVRIATVQANAYGDFIGSKGSGSYAYRVCAVATSICSNTATVTF